MMIAILCDAGKDTAGGEQKATLLIDQEGHINDARIGWPCPDEKGFHWGPVLHVTREEFIYLSKLALGCGA